MGRSTESCQTKEKVVYCSETDFLCVDSWIMNHRLLVFVVVGNLHSTESM